MLADCVLDEWELFAPAHAAGYKGPPSAPPAIPPIIINPFSYQSPAPAIDPRTVPPGPPCIPPPCQRQRL
jgi:hypothetical protein